MTRQIPVIPRSGRRRVPLVLQSEAAECGLACIAMVLGHYGSPTTISQLRGRYSFSARGVTLKTLLEVTHQLGLSGRAVRVDLGAVKRLSTPCILHWDFSHFVVLERTRNGTSWICDPAKGRRMISDEELGRRFTGVAVELRPNAEFGARTAQVLPIRLRDVTGRVRGMGRAISHILGMSAGLQFFVMLIPLYMQWIVDEVLVAGDANLLGVLAAGFALIIVLQALVGAARAWTVTGVATGALVHWNANVFSHLLRLPIGWFEKRNLGDVISRAAATQAIQRTLSTSLVETVIDGAMASATLCLMIFYSVEMTLVAVASAAAYATFRFFTYAPLRARSEQALISAAKQNSHLIESLRGVQTVRLNGAESIREGQLQNVMIETAGHELDAARLRVATSAVGIGVFGLERVLVIWIGAGMVLQGSLSVGMLLAFVAYREQFSARAMGLIDKAQDLRMLRLHVERLSDVVLSEPDRVSENAIEQDPSEISPSVRFVDVSFRYSDCDPWILRSCSFEINAGECVAITGPSGCGKTTAAKLLLGLLKPTEGHIEIGGISLDDFAPSTLRSMVAAVMQDDHLFAGTVADNISLFDVEPDQRRVEAAARQAGVHREIAAMPMRYHTFVGDLSSSLSGGQRQRLILARALYRSPTLLVLDEATSQLDVANERSINSTINSLALTRIVIAHRPETVAAAGRVLLMEGRTLVAKAPPPCVAAVGGL